MKGDLLGARSTPATLDPTWTHRTNTTAQTGARPIRSYSTRTHLPWPHQLRAKRRSRWMHEGGGRWVAVAFSGRDRKREGAATHHSTRVSRAPRFETYPIFGKAPARQLHFFQLSDDNSSGSGRLQASPVPISKPASQSRADVTCACLPCPAVHQGQVAQTIAEHASRE